MINLHLQVRVAGNLEAIQLLKGIAEVPGVELHGFNGVPSVVAPAGSLGQPAVNQQAKAAPPQQGPQLVEDEAEGVEENPPEEDLDSVEPEEVPEVVALPADIPYIGTLRASSLTLAEIEARVRAGEATSIKGIGDAGEAKLREFFGAGEEAVDAEVEVEQEPSQEAPQLDSQPKVELAEVRAKLAQVGTKVSVTQVQKILKALGIPNLGELQPAQYGKAMELANTALAEAK